MRKLWIAPLLFCLSACAVAQQGYVGRYDAFAGFSYLASRDLSLYQRGFNTQVGVNVRRWLAFGFDYSVQGGNGTLVPGELKPSLQALLPPIPGLYVPFSATTQTFAGGPQLAYRHFKKFTLFAHPTIGAIYEQISLKPDNPTTTAIVDGLVGLGLLHSTRPSDTTYFYGVGGGADFIATRHVHLRCDVEYVHTFLFSGLLTNARNAVRVSVGPTFNFGGNVGR